MFSEGRIPIFKTLTLWTCRNISKTPYRSITVEVHTEENKYLQICGFCDFKIIITDQFLKFCSIIDRVLLLLLV